MLIDRLWKLRRACAHILSVLLNRICDPAIEKEISSRTDYWAIQEQRRRHIERILTGYLGPRV